MATAPIQFNKFEVYSNENDSISAREFDLNHLEESETIENCEKFR